MINGSRDLFTAYPLTEPTNWSSIPTFPMLTGHVRVLLRLSRGHRSDNNADNRRPEPEHQRPKFLQDGKRVLNGPVDRNLKVVSQNRGTTVRKGICRKWR
jgi:hypothetical protein